MVILNLHIGLQENLCTCLNIVSSKERVIITNHKIYPRNWYYHYCILSCNDFIFLASSAQFAKCFHISHDNSMKLMEQVFLAQF